MPLRHLSALLWLGLCGFVTACSSNSTPPAPTPTLSGAEVPSNALFRGQLSRLENGEASFTPCQSKESWRFIAEPAFWQRWAQMGNPKQLYAELVTLPLHPGLSTEDVESVCDALVAALK